MRILHELSAILMLCVFAVAGQKEAVPGRVGIENESRIKVSLTLAGGGLGPLRAGQSIVADVWMTNSSDEPVKVCSYHTLAQDRPLLRKEEVLVAYRDEVERVLGQYDDKGCCEITFPPVMVELRPHERTMVGWFVLSQREGVSGNIRWYEPLQAGRYRLSIRRSLYCWSGPRLESETLSFEVVP